MQHSLDLQSGCQQTEWMHHQRVSQRSLDIMLSVTFKLVLDRPDYAQQRTCVHPVALAEKRQEMHSFADTAPHWEFQAFPGMLLCLEPAAQDGN